MFMLADRWNLNQSSFLIEANPTGSEIFRIQHTIENLKRNEAVIFKRENGRWIYPGSIYQDALELCWSWQELNKRVSALPDSFFEKHIWLAEVSEGISRTQHFLQTYQNEFS